ncbi:hypothetical protein [Sphingomonas yabuuchiae]|uniref:hypothetical protein n=1 Tax=Sphingomonas yabuuchiae TaxID=172044 RepID=UPI00128F8593|nr:hypothetical protein [Sphingomonas yabuuchiae]
MEVVYMNMASPIRHIGIFCAFAASIMPIAASAETIGNVKIRNVGNQGTQLYALLEVVPPGCANNVAYHSSETQAGQYVMSILLSAKLTQRPISRMDYTVRAGGICWIDLVEI